MERHNPYAELYVQRGWGDWRTPRQGLTVGMDMLDWMRFILCAVHEIGKDTDSERRMRKITRLMNKALKVQGSHWVTAGFWKRLNQVAVDIENERIGERS